jgi:hypothetical protein
MSLTPSNARMRDATLGAGIKLTPTPSPFATVKSAPRSPIKVVRAEATLALRTVIGTTASNANAFDSLPTARLFAYTAGTAAVVATIDEQHAVSQRFYRARPTTSPINSSSSVYGGPATPTQNESRNRAAASIRDASLGASPHAAPATSDWNDSPNNRAWTAREKIKAATCLGFSPDGKFLAVGEVSRGCGGSRCTAFVNTMHRQGTDRVYSSSPTRPIYPPTPLLPPSLSTHSVSTVWPSVQTRATWRA